MTTPQGEPAPDQVAAPTVSTAPTSGTAAEPPDSRRWNWGAVPHHLGRARTSTVILSVLFLAVFALYLNVRPPDPGTASTPAGGDSDVVAPVVPGLPTESTTPETTEEPAPTTGPGTTPAPTPTGPSTSSPTSPSTPTTEPTGEPDETAGTTDPAEPTGEADEPDTTEPTASPGP